MESVSFTLSTHAEMNAIDTAVAAGYREIKKILVITNSRKPVFPCALCRQKIMEFSENTEVIAATIRGKFATARIRDLYPSAFTKRSLKK